MSREVWLDIGAVSTGILAVLILLSALYRKVVRPVWRAAWRTIRRLSQVADDLLGDEAKGIPSMTQRMANHEQMLAEHLEWHGSPGGYPARPVSPAANSARPRRRPT